MELDRLRTIEGVEVKGRRVLVRADLNVPVKDGKVSDATRLERLMPGIRDLSARGARVVVMSHFGRPKSGPEPGLSLAPIAQSMGRLLGRPVAFAADCIGAPAQQVVAALEDGDVALLENLRFHRGEEKNDQAFAAELARLGDLFVGDAFSCAHRAHASTDAIAALLPSYAGPLLMAEIAALRAALDKPKRPTTAIVGGAKVSTKIPVLTNLVAKVDCLIIGGGMANTFLMAQGIEVGRSLAEPGLLATAREILAAAKAQGCEIALPEDVVIAREFKANAPHDTVPVAKVPPDAMILDVGAKAVWQFTRLLDGSATLLWNGPLGAFETPPFGAGTFRLAEEAAALTSRGTLVSIAGGGDTVAALNSAGVTERFSYVSTAGGAFLEWLEGRELPGIVALTRR